MARTWCLLISKVWLKVLRVSTTNSWKKTLSFSKSDWSEELWTNQCVLWWPRMIYGNVTIGIKCWDAWLQNGRMTAVSPKNDLFFLTQRLFYIPGCNKSNISNRWRHCHWNGERLLPSFWWPTSYLRWNRIRLMKNVNPHEAPWRWGLMRNDANCELWAAPNPPFFAVWSCLIYGFITLGEIWQGSLEGYPWNII